MHRRHILATVSTAITAGIGGCAALGGIWQGPYDVGMSAHAFQPDEVTIDVGESVAWMNDGSRSHTVTAYDAGVPDGGKFFASGDYSSETRAREAWLAEDGGAIYPGEGYEHTFEVPGRYWYFCIPHEAAGMVGEVLVRA